MVWWWQCENIDTVVEFRDKGVLLTYRHCILRSGLEPKSRSYPIIRSTIVVRNTPQRSQFVGSRSADHYDLIVINQKIWWKPISYYTAYHESETSQFRSWNTVYNLAFFPEPPTNKTGVFSALPADIFCAIRWPFKRDLNLFQWHNNSRSTRQLAGANQFPVFFRGFARLVEAHRHWKRPWGL